MLSANMVADINLTEFGIRPSNLVDVHGTLFFAAGNPTNGFELWKSDGTAAGTVLVSDIRPGSDSSNPFNLTNINGTLFFRANDGMNGDELWKSDGTAAGTVLVKDISPGFNSSNPFNLTNVNGTLFFTAFNGSSGEELWKSDGTAAGTVLVRDIRPGFYSSTSRFLTNVNGTLFFSANDGASGNELWKSDGTAAGTVLVRDIRPGFNFSNLFDLTDVNGTLFFRANDGTNGDELWKSDGTAAGTVLVRDIRSGSYGSSPRDLTNVNGTLFFSALNDTNGFELWKSDGTAGGTVLVSDIRPGSNRSYPSNLTNVNGTLFFRANDGVNGYELWRSDGTAAGTVLVSDIRPGINGSYPQNLTNINGTLFFTAFDDTSGLELWKSDGTATGTVLVRDIRSGFNGSNPFNLTNVNGTLFFSANQGVNGIELWKSDGTTAGTLQLSDLNLPNLGSNPKELTNAGGALYFMANETDTGDGWELWKSDGTAAGTKLVKDFPGYPFFGNYYPNELVDVNGVLFFKAFDATYGYELWKSDGTAVGTVLVRDIRPGSNWSNPSNLTNVNGTLFFRANDGTNGYELWKSDGTDAGTVLVRDISPGSSNSYPSNLTNVSGTLFFRANDGTNGYELWKSDGTAAGTVLVSDIRLGSASSGSFNLTNVNGTLFFTANDGVYGYELWKSDGTSAGTVLVKEINLSGDSSPSNLTHIDGRLYFTAFDPVIGTELWSSDGTAAGTTLVADIRPGIQGSDPQTLINFNGTLLLTADDGIHGRELWTAIVEPEPVLGEVEWIRQFGGTGSTELYYAALDGDGNLVTVGLTDSSLPGQVGAGAYDAFVRKYDSNGNELWTRQFGSSGHDSPSSLAIDPTSGAVYVVGAVGGAFPGQQSLGGGADAFLRKYDSDGNEIWTQQFGTSGYDFAGGVSIDAAGAVLVATTVDGAGGRDGQIRKYDSAGNLIWTSIVGTDSYDEVYGIGIDESGAIYVAGSTGGIFPHQEHAGNYDDAFVAKLDQDGNHIWAHQFGTAQADWAYYLTLDSAGNIYVGGQTTGIFSEETGIASDSDGFLVKIDSDGNEQWTRQFGSYTWDFAWQVATDATGIYVAGNENGDAFVRKYSTEGNELGITRIGTALYEEGYGVAVSSAGAVYLVGGTRGDFQGQVSNGSLSAFVVKINQPGAENAPPAAHAGGPYSADEGGFVILSGTASDAENSIVSYEWDLDYDDVNGIFTSDVVGPNAYFDATNLDGGTSRMVALRVRDAGDLESVDTSLVTIVNAPPRVSIKLPKGGNIVNEGTPYFLPLVHITDGPNDVHTATINWGDGTIEAGIVDPLTHQVNGSHVYTGPAGSITVTVTDEDGSGQAVLEIGFNLRPIITSSPVTTATVGQLYTYIITSVDPDRPADSELVPVISSEAIPDWLNPERIFSPKFGGFIVPFLEGTPSDADLGASEITLRVTDALGAFSEQTFTLTVLPPNRPPAADASGPYTVAENGTVQLSGSGSSDPDQDAATLIYEWDLDGDGVFGETGTVAAHGSEIGVFPTFSALGLTAANSSVTVGLRVTDAQGASNQTTAQITINAPTVSDLGNVVGNIVASGGDTVQLAVTTTDTQLFLNAIASLPPNPDSDVTITLTASQGTIGRGRISVPEGYTLIIVGANGRETVFQGGSPALTVESGTVIMTGVTFINSTDAPSILVTGGQLAIRNSTIEETTGGAQAAIHIAGGTVDLGTSAALGGNTITVHGDGEFIRNLTSANIYALGNIFQIDSVTLSDPFAIEDEVYHALDAAGLGLVSFLDTNVDPRVRITSLSPALLGVGGTVSFAGSFRDVGSIQTHAAQWSITSATSAANFPGTVSEVRSSGTVAGSYTFTTPGVYRLKLTVSDGAGGAGQVDSIVQDAETFIVVYDPAGGFVTGGGWINSPAGAYVPDATLAGKATFGFVSKYQKGAKVPTGETEFQFKVANLNFHSSSYEWLVVAGARAQYKGVGTINGTGNYGFLLTAIDGQVTGGGGADKFRIKIWDKNNGGTVVYDNQLGASDDATPSTLLGGGQIVIQKDAKGGNGSGAFVGEALDAALADVTTPPSRGFAPTARAAYSATPGVMASNTLNLLDRAVEVVESVEWDADDFAEPRSGDDSAAIDSAIATFDSHGWRKMASDLALAAV